MARADRWRRDLEIVARRRSFTGFISVTELLTKLPYGQPLRRLLSFSGLRECYGDLIEMTRRSVEDSQEKAPFFRG
jgi:hypothetical protein